MIRFIHSPEVLQNTVASLVILSLLIVSFVVFEPRIGMAIDETFTVTQVVTGEISMTTPDPVTLASITGLTGGTRNGSTVVVVTTNDTDGYNMTLRVDGDPALQGNVTSGEIPDYTPTTPNVPDFTFSVPANTAEFGYTIESPVAGDVAPLFRDDGVDTCATGANNTADSCWLNASTTGVTIMNRTSETLSSGSTTTIKFRLTINSDPSPALPEDTYVATTTLTALTNI